MGTLHIQSFQALQKLFQKNTEHRHVSRIILDVDDVVFAKMGVNRSELLHCIRSEHVFSRTDIIFVERNGKHRSTSQPYQGVHHGYFNH